MRKTKTIYKYSLESRQRMSKSHIGMKASLSHRQNISIALKGKQRSPEHCFNLSKAHLGKTLSLETRKKISLSLQANKEKHPNWKGGITPINIKIRMSRKYKQWRTAVFVRDKYTCVLGGKNHGNKLQADHIKPFALFPELRFTISNGRTLCVECHKKTETYGARKNIYEKI